MAVERGTGRRGIFASQQSVPPVRQEEKPSGRRRSIWEMFSGAGETPAKGLVPRSEQLINRFLSPALAGLQEPAPGYEEGRSFVEEKFGGLGEHYGEQARTMRESIFGPGSESAPTPDSSIDPQAQGAAPGEDLVASIQETSARMQLIELASKSDNLTPEHQELLDEQKRIAGEEFARLDREIQAQMASLQFTDAVLQKELDPGAEIVLPKVLPLVDAEDIPRGVSEEWFNTYLENTDDPDVLKALTDAAYIKKEVVTEIENFVFEKNQLKREMEMFETNLAKESAILSLPGGRFNLVDQVIFGDQVIEGPEASAIMEFQDNIDIPGVELLPASQQQDLALDMLTVLANPVGGDPQAQLSAIATKFSLDPVRVKDSFNHALEAYTNAIDELSTLEGATKVSPGSKQMAMTIYQAALNYGLDVGFADELANSELFHLTLSRSGGNAKFAPKGTSIRGVGALREEVYTGLGRPWETVEGDMSAQLEVLFEYLAAGWPDQDGGFDFRAAYIESLEAGEWGSLALLNRSPVPPGSLLGGGG